jgi:diguanylate cyclase (GGDEF)-like protein
MHAVTCPRFDELKATDRLPTPNAVALALLRLTGSEASIQEIASVLEGDPALVGRVLKLANSAAARGSKAIVATREAVVRLGGRAVSNLALGFWLVSQSGALVCRRFNYDRYWQHSLAIAVVAKTLAALEKEVVPDAAFTCGLLSQVGRLALATIYPDAYAEILARCERDGQELLAPLERQHFATDHVEVTAALLADWGLPPEYSDAIFFQSLTVEHRPESSRAGMLARVLDLAIHLARVCLEPEDQGDRDRLLQACLARGRQLGVESATLVELADRALGEEWRRWGQILNVTVPAVPSFAELADRPAPQPDVILGPPIDGLRVLIVSANTEATQRLAELLMAAGHTPTLAADREGALRNLLAVAPQALIVDGFRTGGEGAALCRHLRQARLGRDLYILALAESAEEAALTALFDAGADDFLVKPVTAAGLAVRLRASQRLLSLRQELQHDKEELRRFAADLAVANRRLHHAAYEDALTRLPNRRCAMERLEQEWAGASRTEHPLACILADIDHFKSVNDTHGHDIGDQVLRATAEALRGGVRGSDLVCRLGGEEFVVVCPHTDLAGARTCAERLRTRVAGNRIRKGTFEGTVTISLGVAAREASMKRPDDLLKTADRAVYQAKRTGRNRACV